MLKFKILIIFCLTCNIAFAQKLVFKVIALTGNAKTQEQKLKVGIELFDNQEITVQENTYLTLIHPNGRTLELAKVGNYQIKDLEDLLLKNENPHLTIFKSKQRPKIFEYISGTIEYSFGRNTIFFPKSSKIYQIQKIPIAWEKSISHSEPIVYKFNILNIFDDVISQIELIDTSYVFDLPLLIPKLEDDEVFIEIKVKSIRYYPYDGKRVISFINKEEVQIFEEKYKVFQQKNKEFPSTTYQKVSEAMFLEENGFLIEAMFKYQEIVKSNPQNDVFEIMYHQFLYRKGVAQYWLRNHYPNRF